MPISFVRSSTTTFMMFETPIPPTTSVSDPTMPRKRLKASMKLSKNSNCCVVSQTESASLSFGSNLFRSPSAARTFAVTFFAPIAGSAW